MAKHVCPWRHAYLFDNILRRLVHNPKKILSPYLNPEMTVMDLGCGMGFFSIAMAKMLGSSGSVIAVDLQQEMLDVLAGRAAKKGVAQRIRLHRCEAGHIGVKEKVDFALAFWMVHEIPDQLSFARQVLSCLKPSGKFMIVEPRFHVSQADFQGTLGAISAAGFHKCGEPHIRLSRTAVFEDKATV